MKRKIYSPNEKVKIEVYDPICDGFGGYRRSWRLWKETTCKMQQVFSRSNRNIDFLLYFGWSPNFPANFRVVNKRGELLYPITMPIENGFESIKCMVRKNNNERL